MIYIANAIRVEAWPITEVSEPDEHGARVIRSADRKWMADAGMLARITPVVGDYMVLQADGYLYLNPKYVFERKYRRDDDRETEIRGAVARGWCHPKNSAKVFDHDLAEAIAEEVSKLFLPEALNVTTESSNPQRPAGKQVRPAEGA